MNRLVRCLAIAFAAAVFLLSGPAEAGTCKLSIILDRSGSMKQRRTSDQLTRCEVATQGVLDAVYAFSSGNDYIVNSGEQVSSTDPYDLNCPVSDPSAVRLVSIWGFENNVLMPLTDGFIAASAASGALQRSNFYDQPDPNAPDFLVPRACLDGATPLAQGMFESARVFGAPGAPPVGEIRRAIIFTDGDENYSDAVPLPTGSTRIRLPGDPAQPNIGAAGTWGNKIKLEYNSRGVNPTGFLYEGGAVSLMALAVASETVPGRSGAQALAAGSRGYPVSADVAFFQALAAQTGGTFVSAPDSAPVAASASLLDTDGDGIPDFRDLCDTPGCVDGDGDGIPNVIDQCGFSREDGRGANPGDGCPDGDADGIPNSRDACLTQFEDYLQPKPTDGCPKPVVSAAVPAAPIGYLMVMGLGMIALGSVAASRRQRPVSVV